MGLEERPREELARLLDREWLGRSTFRVQLEEARERDRRPVGVVLAIPRVTQQDLSTSLPAGLTHELEGGLLGGGQTVVAEVEDRHLAQALRMTGILRKRGFERLVSRLVAPGTSQGPSEQVMILDR